MAMRWSRRGKEIAEETVEAEDVKELLPERLFATDRKPLRFTLVGFGEVMGLSCGEFEDGYSIDFHLSHKDENYEYWDRLIGSDMYVAVVESETEMSG
ncbi:hypothetical protein F2Q70_00044708 [Brassica cretica]|uniref:Uncharacterized protein n=1 Tax=Brassica cretica TaxID=69181 RepID=A0A8S9KDD0_BRACR|nr:hypothetical protein F2Q70_00044708 [Brassica cretica]KAF2607837.1 hypothetical protein F2Q68_00045658 [Brassica cretica]